MEDRSALQRLSERQRRQLQHILKRIDSLTLSQRRTDEETSEQTRSSSHSSLLTDDGSQVTPLRHPMTLRSCNEMANKTAQATTSTLTAFSTIEPVVRASSPVPPGYKFLPKGNPYLTRNARAQTQLAHQVVYAVVNNDKKQVGIRVPSSIYDAVLQSEKATRQNRRQIVIERDMSLEKRFREASEYQTQPFPPFVAMARRFYFVSPLPIIKSQPNHNSSFSVPPHTP